MSETVMVVGCGTMGSGIAQVAAFNGCDVILFDAFPGAAQKGLERITHFLGRDAEKGRCTAEERDAAIARLRIGESLEEAKGANFVIEAIREKLEDKQDLFAKLDAIAGPETILLSNTSMISITNIAGVAKHPERIAGCHFFNPVPLMKLVEIIPGEKTAQSTVDRASALVSGWSKVAIPAPDTPGFIVNRALLMLMNESAFLVEEGNEPKNVDEAMRLGCNFPMGPLELMDLVGLDVVLDCQAALWEQYDRNPKYEPCKYFSHLIGQGKLGRKSGAGFYDYAPKAGAQKAGGA